MLEDIESSTYDQTPDNGVNDRLYWWVVIAFVLSIGSFLVARIASSGGSVTFEMIFWTAGAVLALLFVVLLMFALGRVLSGIGAKER